MSVAIAPKYVGRKEYPMEMPAMFKGESLTRLGQGAFVGAVVTMIIGFNWGGWVLGKTAEDNATLRVNADLCVSRGSSIRPTWKRSGSSSRRSKRGAATATSRIAASQHLQARHHRTGQLRMHVQERLARSSRCRHRSPNSICNLLTVFRSINGEHNDSYPI